MIKSLVDLRGSFGPARDQNPRPTCMAFAASDAHAGARSGWTPLSTEWAYYHAVKREGGLPHQGASLNAMLATIKSDGQPVEEEWPYRNVPISDVASWAPPAPARQLFFRDHGLCALTVNDVIDQLNAGLPVLMTMTLSNAFFRPTADGTVERIEPPDPKLRHAVVAVGYGERASTNFVLVRNSWGGSWGIEGHAWISIDYLTPRLTGAAILTTEL
ncbi:C1 family peptidase [Bradyrhizobium lupini]|uniref:C1 family peptidase n=1 Tax=Rhizobium lupini TaxID=136996 RepID=UPI0036713FE8